MLLNERSNDRRDLRRILFATVGGDLEHVATLQTSRIERS